MLRSGIWIVWGLGILGVLLFGGLQKLIEFWWLFFATGLLAGASMVVVRSLERLKDMDTRLQIQADQLQQLQAQLDRLTQAKNRTNRVDLIRRGAQRAPAGSKGSFGKYGRTVCAPAKENVGLHTPGGEKMLASPAYKKVRIIL